MRMEAPTAPSAVKMHICRNKRCEWTHTHTHSFHLQKIAGGAVGATTRIFHTYHSPTCIISFVPTAALTGASPYIINTTHNASHHSHYSLATKCVCVWCMCAAFWTYGDSESKFIEHVRSRQYEREEDNRAERLKGGKGKRTKRGEHKEGIEAGCKRKKEKGGRGREEETKWNDQDA